MLGIDNLEMKEIDVNLNNSIKTISTQMAAEMNGINDNMTAMEAAIDEKFKSIPYLLNVIERHVMYPWLWQFSPRVPLEMSSLNKCESSLTK